MIKDIVPASKEVEASLVDLTPDSLGEAQELFTHHLRLLLEYIEKILVCTVRLGETYRPVEWQREMVKRGLSRTYNSRHTHKLAADIFIVKQGKVTWELEDYEKAGEFWKSLDPNNNVWGGDWVTLRDAVHFERRPPQ